MEKNEDYAKLKEEEQQRQQEERRLILRTILTQEASERLNRIATVKPDKVNMIQNAILTNVKQGRIRGKVDDDMLKSLIQSLSFPDEQNTSIKIQRRRWDDSDSDV